MKTDEILDLLTRNARRCERAGKAFDTAPVAGMWQQLQAAIGEVGKAWSGNFMGRHSLVYIEGLRPRRPREWYSQFNDFHGPWVEYNPEFISGEIIAQVGMTSLETISQAAKTAHDAFAQSRQEALPALEAILAHQEDDVIRRIKDELQRLSSHTSRDDFARQLIPSGSYATTWEDVSLGDTNLRLPPHLSMLAGLLAQRSYVQAAKRVSEKIHYLVQYLQLRHQFKGATVAKIDGKVFIGHGGSPTWRDLKDFLQDRLGLAWEEFNREPTAGRSTKERLEDMLDEAVFAFLVMTAEDERADGTKHARGNVIHEVGLFQGRLGFEKAIVLLEDGCSEFSNIVGLTQIRFPKGNIMAKSEEIRRVLEREGIIKQ